MVLVLILFLYCIMCTVTFASTFLGIVLLEEVTDINVYERILSSVLSAVFWPAGLPISIGMIAVSWIIRKHNGK